MHLTTHRLLFHALLPPDDMLLNSKSESVQSPEDAAASGARQSMSYPDILMEGPVTIHRWGPLTSRRLWLEVTPEMITGYPGADEKGRVRPIRSVLRRSRHF